MAEVVPIYNNGDKHIISNDRPVPLLPHFPKILEKLFVNRLHDYMEQYELSSDHQYGFSSNPSTALAVMELVENRVPAIDNKQYAVGVFVDLWKAFDTMNHSLLLQKLEPYGIRGVPLHRIRSYFNNRLNNTVSPFRKVTCGLPQGSIMSRSRFFAPDPIPIYFFFSQSDPDFSRSDILEMH